MKCRQHQKSSSKGSCLRMKEERKALLVSTPDLWLLIAPLVVQYADDTYREVKIPVRKESPVPLHYQRMLALTESTNQINGQPMSEPSFARIDPGAMLRRLQPKRSAPRRRHSAT